MPKKNVSQKAFQLYLKEIEQYSNLKLTPEEEKELFKRIKKGDVEAEKKLARSYLMLVVKIVQYYVLKAKHYRPRAKKLSILYLIGEGNYGLWRAIDLYEWRSNYRFSLLATLMIWEAISEAFRTGRDIVTEVFSEIKKERKKLFDISERTVVGEIYKDHFVEAERKKLSYGEKIMWKSKIKKSVKENTSEIIKLLSEVTALSRSEAEKEIEEFLKE